MTESFPQNSDLVNKLLSGYQDKRFHLEDRKVAIKNSCLHGIKIAYVVTGGIAAVESPKIIRELRRLGAKVRVYASTHALEFITPLSLEWASSQPIVTSLSATAEHVFTEDILLVCPATANIISKAATGIADETVSTLIAGAFGKRKWLLKNKDNTNHFIPPVLMMIPTMHVFLSTHPVLVEHFKVLEKNGFVFLESRKDEGEEDKLKMPNPETIATWVAHSFYQNYYRYGFFAGKGYEFENDKSVKSPTKKPQFNPFNPIRDEVLITAGATSEALDGVRTLTNQGTGETGLELAYYLHTLGIRVRLLVSSTQQKTIPPHLLGVSDCFDDFLSYEKQVFQILEKRPIFWGIFTAAVSDFKPQSSQSKEKILSHKPINIKLQPHPKIIAKVRKKYPNLTMVVFKYLVGKSVPEIYKTAHEMLKSYDYVAVNRKEDLTSSKKVRYFFNSDFTEPLISQNNQELSFQVIDFIIGSFSQRHNLF